MTTPRSCLERLFTRHPPGRFLQACWPGRPAVCHGPLARLAPLGELPELTDLKLLLTRFGAPIRVALADKRDEHSAVDADPTAALAHHRAGRALILDGVERVLPEAAQWLTRLAHELGLPRQCQPRCIVYATPRGAGNSPHFDANANFVVQLRGTKRWRLAPNRHVVDPTDRWAMNQAQPTGELGLAIEGPLPTRMPKGSRRFDLKPGSVLFVPRGYWHSTEADHDTLALNFTFGQPTWADVALEALRQRLVVDPRWRALATGFSPFDPAPLRAMLRRLGPQVAALNAEQVLESMGAPRRYRLVPEGFLHLEGRALKASVGRREFTLKTPARLKPALQWVARCPGDFSMPQLASAFPHLSDALPALLATLTAQGLLVDD